MKRFVIEITDEAMAELRENLETYILEAKDMSDEELIKDLFVLPADYGERLDLRDKVKVKRSEWS